MVWYLCTAGGTQPGVVLRQLGRVQRRVETLFVVRPVAWAVAQNDVVVLQDSPHGVKSRHRGCTLVARHPMTPR